MKKKEQRVFPMENLAIEKREDDEGNEVSVLVGYAAVFGKNSVDLGGFTEVIRRGAFREALAGDDVRALKNHDTNYLLGRSSSGTLRLKEDRDGLRMEIDLPNTTVGNDTREEIRRGDLTGASFSFETIDDKWEKKEGKPLRTLVKARLFDVGPVVFPAYPDTSIGLRSLERFEEKENNDLARALSVETTEQRLDIARKERINADV